jgi:hypothetical protein
MKSGIFVVLGACAALAVLVLAVRPWHRTVAPDAPAAIGHSGPGANRNQSADGRRSLDGHATNAPGHDSVGALGGASKPSGDRAAVDTEAGGDHRVGAAAVVRGAERATTGGTAAGAAGNALATGDSLGTGDVRLADRAQASKRDVPDMPSMPKQLSEAMAGSADNAAPPAPEVAYDGGADHVFSTKSQMQVPDAANITGDAGTVSFWVKPEWGPTSQDDATFVQLGDSGLQVVKNVNFLRFEYIDQNGTENGLGTNLGEWPDQQWRQVTATWTNGNLALYVDGQLISQNRYQFPPTFGEETKLLVGTNFPGPIAPGQMSNVTVLNRTSSATEVANNFQSGPRPNN